MTDERDTLEIPPDKEGSAGASGSQQSVSAESFFPLDIFYHPFKRSPYPESKYHEALHAAQAVLWNMSNWPNDDENVKLVAKDAQRVMEKLGEVYINLQMPHKEFLSRSQQRIDEFNSLWRTKVEPLLGWFKKVDEC